MELDRNEDLMKVIEFVVVDDNQVEKPCQVAPCCSQAQENAAENTEMKDMPAVNH